jgi:hypothetical protein
VGRKEGGQFLAARIDARAGGEVVVVESALRPTPLVLGRTKGRADVYQSVGTGYGVVGGALGSLTSSSEVALVYRRRLGEHWLVGPRAAFGIADVSDRGLAYQYRAAVLELMLLRTIPIGGIEILLGGTGGGVYASQRLLSGETSSGLVWRLAGVLGLDIPLASRFSATFNWTMGGAMLRLNDEWTARPFVRADLGVSYGF